MALPALLHDKPAKARPARHRHSAVQLAALNGVYEQTAHPTLAQRTALAQSLGLEIKSVNAFFQNKRASSKKQARGGPYDAIALALLPPSVPAPVPAPARAYSAVDDDYYYPPVEDVNPPPHQQFRSHQDPHPGDHASHFAASDARQIDELQRIYRLNARPTPEETQRIAERIGSHYQSIADWFRTQRSLHRMRARADAAEPDLRAHLTLPPLNLPPAPPSPPLGGLRLPALQEDRPYVPRIRRRSSSPALRHASPYGPAHASASSSSTSTSSAALSARQRRGRPDALQLGRLRRLLSETPTPTLEERAALAREIGMDVGRVGNWFRNVRQSRRKKGARGSEDEMDGSGVYLSSTSRSASVSRSEGEWGRGGGGGERHSQSHSSDEEEEEAQEAVTPASTPPPLRYPGLGGGDDTGMDIDGPLDEKVQARFSRVPIEDAMLLLGFHRRAGMF